MEDKNGLIVAIGDRTRRNDTEWNETKRNETVILYFFFVYEWEGGSGGKYTAARPDAENKQF